MLAPLTNQRAREIVDGMQRRRIVVLGDVMLDEFVWGDVTRISPEAPVPVVDIRRESVHLGGAANVLANVVALGATGSVVGVIGNDPAGERIKTRLHELTPNSDDYLIVDEKRPSTTKTRIIAHSQLVVRADREHRGAVNGSVEKAIVANVTKAISEADALVVSDYDKGVVTPAILKQVLELAHKRIPVLIDPKIKNFSYYRPASLITPNHFEALRLTDTEQDTDEGLHHAATIIRERLDCDAVLITRGERGIMLLERDQDPVFVDTAAREVYDVTGAGDTVIATLAAALAAGASTLEAAHLANHAAGIVVGKLGTATATATELIATFV
ncbi:MAG TPA: D-glycero-beta-D-manno-heptose-7-phosphate kinase [Pyrinomonadaceae bacterium]|nr:D-glycero-beta-D-manno-heptose-7-phosphate kinase [Pyrinomonadaceae bacterium]